MGWGRLGPAAIPTIGLPRNARRGGQGRGNGKAKGNGKAEVPKHNGTFASTFPFPFPSAFPFPFPSAFPFPRPQPPSLTPFGSGCRGRALILGRKQSACGLRPATPQARSSVVEHYLDTVGVVGSIPIAP